MQSDNKSWVQAGAAMHGNACSGDSSHPDKQTLAVRGHCVANEGGQLPSPFHHLLRSNTAESSAGPALHSLLCSCSLPCLHPEHDYSCIFVIPLYADADDPVEITTSIKGSTMQEISLLSRPWPQSTSDAPNTSCAAVLYNHITHIDSYKIQHVYVVGSDRLYRSPVAAHVSDHLPE